VGVSPGSRQAITTPPTTTQVITTGGFTRQVGVEDRTSTI